MSVILCTAGYDHTIRFWEALSGICSRTISHPDSQVNRLCISPDKRYLAAAGHHTIKLYDIKSSNPQPILVFEGHTNNVTGVAFHCEGKWMVTSSEDGTVRIWDTRTGNVQRNYSHGIPVNDVVIHPNQGELISCDRGGTVRVWDLGENRCSHGLVPEEGVSVASVTVASDGSMLCAGNNRGTVFVWRMIQSKDITSIVPVCRFQAHSNYITRVLLSPDVRHLATCSADHTAKIWSVDLNHSSSQNGSLANSMVNSAVTDSSSSRATSESGYGPQQRSRSQQRDRSYSGASPGDTAAAAMNGLNLNGAAAMPTQNGHPNGTAGPESSDSFPLETVLGGHQRWVWDCAFSADSAYLVTACSDHYARLWELSSQSIIRQYNGHHRGAVCVALNDTALG